MNENFVVYLCLRSDDSSGMPRRTPELADLLLSRKSYEVSVSCVFWAFYFAVFSMIRKLMVETKGNLKEAKRVFNGFWFDICCKDVISTENRALLEFLKIQMTNIGSHLAKKDLGEIDIVAELENSTFLKMEEHMDKAPILFCFDEARGLMTNSLSGGYVGSSFFALLRRVLSEFPSSLAENKIPCPITLFTDTTSRIGNISPSLVNDPSFRVNSKGQKLFPPFYYMDNIDILADSSDSNKLVVTFRNLDSHERLFKMGRPFWGACIIQKEKKNLDTSKLDDIVSIAKAKIVGGTKFHQWLSNLSNGGVSLSENEVLSILGSRLAINICPYSQASHTLVSNFMALCLWISEDRRALASKMCSEPILAHASAIVFDMMKSEFRVKALQILAQSMRKGIVEAGYRGELVTRVLLIMAWDSLWKSQNPSEAMVEVNVTRKILARDYLKHLLSKHVMDSMKDWKFLHDDNDDNAKIDEYWIFFTHFMTLNYTPKKADILSCMKRGAAIICRQNEWGIDLIIPMIRTSSSSSAAKDEVLQDDDVTFILISVKNYKTCQKKADFEASSTYKMNPSYVGIVEHLSDLKLPYITLYMDVGCPEVGFLTRQLDDFKRSTRTSLPDMNHNICLFGMNAEIFNECWLTDDIIPVLADLREARLDLLNSAPFEKDRSHIILSLPGEYPEYAKETANFKSSSSQDVNMDQS